MWKVKVAMSVLIDKSVCPHASGQRTAMHVCDERGRGAQARGGGAFGLARCQHVISNSLIISFRELLGQCVKVDKAIVFKTAGLLNCFLDYLKSRILKVVCLFCLRTSKLFFILSLFATRQGEIF